MNEICIKNLDKVYSQKIVFKDFHYTFKAGKIYAIIGESGSGKPTLLNMIGLLDDPTHGSICYDHVNINSHHKKTLWYLRNKINYLFQNYALIETDTVLNNLKIALKHVRSSHKEQLIKDSLKKVGLEGYEKEKVYCLSGGQQQRVALARLYLKPADVILADEPTGNLDEKNKKLVLETLKEFAEEGKIVIVATHDLSIVHQCDEVIELTRYTD